MFYSTKYSRKKDSSFSKKKDLFRFTNLDSNGKRKVNLYSTLFSINIDLIVIFFLLLFFLLLFNREGHWFVILDSTTGKHFYANPYIDVCTWKKPKNGKIMFVL